MFSKKLVFGKALGVLWLAVVGLVAVSVVAGALSTPKNLAKRDYYGWYVVDRTYFPGRQADWQYNSLRFRITPGDSLCFYLTDREKIVRTYRGHISTVMPYSSARLVLDMEQPTYHVVASNPTTYRSAWGFNLIFHSARFNNVYFKKGERTPLSD